MKPKVRKKLDKFVKKFDVWLLLASLPLVPMLIAEFFIGVDVLTLKYFNVYYVALWFVFTLEFFLNLYLAKSKITYIREHWLDALVVLAPVFRSFKVFHILRAPILLVSDEVIKLFKALKLNFLYFFIVTIVIILITADVVLFFERFSPESNITTFEDAVWWGFVTFSTLGYGDRFPVTFGGRVMAILLMTLGFALFSILAANAVSFFMKRGHRDQEKKKERDMIKKIKKEIRSEEILKRLESIEDKLDKKD